MDAAGTVSAAVDDDAAVGTDELRETRRLPARICGRRRFLLAESALEERAEPLASTFGVESPRPQLERGLVADVPPMTTRKLGNPIAAPVLVISDDLALHRVSVRGADGGPSGTSESVVIAVQASHEQTMRICRKGVTLS